MSEQVWAARCGLQTLRPEVKAEKLWSTKEVSYPMKELVSGYCIYTDTDSVDLSLEHIIPLSLGGHDKFSINVDRKANNGPASKIDSSLANDFAILFDRRKLGATGHSGKRPMPIAKRSTFEGRKVQARFEDDGLKLYDVMLRKDIDPEIYSGKNVEIGGIQFHMDDPLRFVAKVALSAGLYAYGDDFRNQVNHQEARIVMMADNFTKISPNIRCLDRWQLIEDDKHQIIWLIASQYRESCVMLMPGYDCFCVAVGLLGHFIGFLNIPAPSHRLQNIDDYDLGHVITIRDGQILRRSFRQVINELGQDIEEKNDNIIAAFERMAKRTAE